MVAAARVACSLILVLVAVQLARSLPGMPPSPALPEVALWTGWIPDLPQAADLLRHGAIHLLEGFATFIHDRA